MNLEKTLINSTIVTVLLIALPIALNTISLEPFSYKEKHIRKKKKKGQIQGSHNQDNFLVLHIQQQNLAVHLRRKEP